MTGRPYRDLLHGHVIYHVIRHVPLDHGHDHGDSRPVNPAIEPKKYQLNLYEIKKENISQYKSLVKL